jgi:hypothetical protein
MQEISPGIERSESDIAKDFPFRPTYSSYDSEIKTKKSKRAKKRPA